MAPSKMAFLQESHLEEGKADTLVPARKGTSALATCQATLQERMGSMMGRAPPFLDCLVTQTSCPLRKPQLHIGIPKIDLGRSLDTFTCSSSLCDHVE